MRVCTKSKNLLTRVKRFFTIRGKKVVFQETGPLMVILDLNNKVILDLNLVVQDWK